MPLNLALIGASTAAGGAAVTALPIHSTIHAAGTALVVIGTMIVARRNMDETLAGRLEQIRAEAKRSSDLNRKQAELLERMTFNADHSGPNTLPPPPLRRIG